MGVLSRFLDCKNGTKLRKAFKTLSFRSVLQPTLRGSLCKQEESGNDCRTICNGGEANT